MSTITISVPITKEQEHFIKQRVKSGVSANRAHAVRQALDAMKYEEQHNTVSYSPKLIRDVLQAEKEIREGKGLRGDLNELLKRI